MRLDKILLVSILLVSIGLSFTQTYSDDFQTYGTAQDPSFVQKYLTNFTLNNPVYNPWIQSIVQSPSDSLTWKILYNTGGQMVSTNFMTAYNYSIISTSKPFTFSQVIRPDSQIIVEGNGNTMEWYFYLFENTSANYNAKSIVEKLNTTKGYLLTIQFPYSLSGTDPIHVMLSRCATGLTAPNAGQWDCPQVLGTTSSIIASNNTGMTSYYSSGGLHGRVQYNVINPMRMKVVVENDNTIRFFMNNGTYADVERFSFLDTAPLFNFTGGLIQGMDYDASHSNSYQSDDVKLYVDDLSYLNRSDYTGISRTQVVSYPSYNDTNPITLVDQGNSTIANWIALNQPFRIQFSFNTPSGFMNKITETTCPVRIWGELGYGVDPNARTDNIPQIYYSANTPNSDNKCVLYAEWSNSQPEVNYYPWTCYGYQQCALTWQTVQSTVQRTPIPIRFGSWTNGGAWSTVYKTLDISNKLFYQGTPIVCSSPANITVLIEYQDKNMCSYPSYTPDGLTYVTFNVTNTSIGTCPSDGTICDSQVNGTCWNACNISGSTGIPTAPPSFNCTDPVFCTYHPTANQTGAEGAGITDSFDQSQVGGIAKALMSPAFIGIIICMALALFGAVYGGQLIGAIGFIGAFFFLTWWGLFPLWVGLGVIMLASFATVYLVRDIFTSG